MANSFDRIGFVKILPYGSSKWLTLNGLDIKFDISKPIGAVCMDAKISILGLSRDNIKTISTWAAEAVAYAKKTRIQVFAGYSNTEANCIFDGFIVYAMPTMPPDVWLNINARSGYFREAQVTTGSVSETESTLKHLPDWLKDMCSFIGVDYDIKDILDISGQVTFKAYTGTVTYQDVVRDMKKECDKRNVIMIETIQSNGKSIFKFSKRYSGHSDNPVKISKDDGMIGIPRITWNEIEVTTLLSNIAEGMRGNYIDVYSRFAMPGMFDSKGNKRSADDENIYHAVYRVNNVRYYGHLRGQEWYVTYKAWRNFESEDQKLPEVTI